MIELALFPVVIVSHGGSLLSKEGFSTQTLSEFGREPLLLVLKFQLDVGHPRSWWCVSRLGHYDHDSMIPYSLWWHEPSALPLG
jgi:hypothetical protein